MSKVYNKQVSSNEGSAGRHAFEPFRKFATHPRQ